MPRESEVVRVAREYREQLARNESEALRLIARLWVKMERGLQSGYEDLAREVLARMARGEMVPRQFIYTMQRYQSMMDQIRKEMPYYQGTIEDLVTDYQKENYTLGLDASQAIIKASRPSDDTWTRIYKDAAETMTGFAGNGAPLHSLLHRDYNQTAENVLDALIEGVGLGKGYREVARDMQDAMGGDFDRAMRIARTEMNRSYRLANAEQYRASGVVTKVIRLCYKPTACFACLMLDGEECKDFICDDHPNGKCTTIVQTTGGIMPEWETGREWLEEQTEEDQRRIMGAGRFELWKKHGVDPKSMVYIKPNPVWGGSPAMRPIKELFANGISPVYESNISISNTTDQSKISELYLGIKRGIAREEDLIKHFGEKKAAGLDIETALKSVNSEHPDIEEFRRNCQRCVPAYELGRRGYDVEALPRIIDKKDNLAFNAGWIFDHKDDDWHYLKGNGKTELNDLMQDWGDGARAEVFVLWGNSNRGHVFVAENYNGKIIYVDPQTGKYGADVEEYFNHVQLDSVFTMRIDDKQFTNWVFDCAKKKE